MTESCVFVNGNALNTFICHVRTFKTYMLPFTSGVEEAVTIEMSMSAPGKVREFSFATKRFNVHNACYFESIKAGFISYMLITCSGSMCLLC